MKENSFLPSEEPQEQHQGEGPQGILWQNLLSSISQLFIVRSSSSNFFFLCKTIIQEIHMRENSFLQSEEPQGQHQGQGAQGILWRNLLSSISQPLIDQSS